jgi:hypothetical protein
MINREPLFFHGECFPEKAGGTISREDIMEGTWACYRNRAMSERP